MKRPVTVMTTCTSCGYKVPAGKSTCPHCGAKLK
jgi:predicted RNA-binding Zn-ribbon protein involved in translation (DUF1610 family)